MRPINPSNNNGSIQLKFSFGGKRYNFNPVKGGTWGNRADMAKAQAVATQIQLDILAGHFDESLERYRPTSSSPQQAKANSKPHESLLECWDAWVSHLSLPPHTKANHYECVRRMIEKHGSTLMHIEWFTSSTLAPSTFNKRLGMLKSCMEWAVKQKLVPHNPYESVKPRKEAKKSVVPFSQQELGLIINGFTQRFPHYVPFVQFLAMTGTRISEAIGLRWQHVSLERNEIVIRESCPRDRTGNGHQTVRKGTKTGSVRHLTMTPQLREMLLGLERGKHDDLVFRSSKGHQISADNFREDWQAVLQTLPIPYRSPHKLRHTLLSMALEAGTPATGVAYIAGHSDTRMVMQTYGHMINRPSLPAIDL